MGSPNSLAWTRVANADFVQSGEEACVVSDAVVRIGVRGRGQTDQRYKAGNSSSYDGQFDPPRVMFLFP